jgi:hypothetical protein
MLIEAESQGFGNVLHRDLYEVKSIKTGEVEAVNVTHGTYLGKFPNKEKFMEFITVNLRGKILEVVDQ